MKFLGIDYGTKRVGVALSDDEGTMAFPKTVLTNDEELLVRVKELIETEQVGEVVVGESKNLDGSENPIMESIAVFVKELKQLVAVPVHFEPEFYTSYEARRLVNEANQKSQKAPVDAQAAAIILNSYILRKRV